MFLGLSMNHITSKTGKTDKICIFDVFRLFWHLRLWPFLQFFFNFFNFFFIHMKIIQRFLDNKDGTKCWWVLWFPAKNQPPQTFQSPVYNSLEENKFIRVFFFIRKQYCSVFLMWISWYSVFLFIDKVEVQNNNTELHSD